MAGYRPARSLFAAIAVAGASLFGSASSSAEDALRLVGPDFPPFYVKEAGGVGGSLTELLTDLVAEAGIRVASFDILPTARAIDMLARGDADATLLVENTTLAQAGVLRSDRVVGELVLEVVARPGQPVPTTRDELVGRSLAVMRGYSYAGLAAWLRERNVEMTEANDEEQVVRMVEAGRVDAALLYDVNLAGAEARLGRALEVERRRFIALPVYIMLNARLEGAPDLLRRLSDAYDRMVADGRIARPPDG